ncbi:aggrecan core protein-like [Gigantopelta aegis]|uniref:aggrecan core protein-like n=1 Tax=Gigantopelta aegis TaxID=1735272 RepID=UPI001B889A5E|nr:aggrecan core protein-like [Gigantopelta aegis]
MMKIHQVLTWIFGALLLVAEVSSERSRQLIGSEFVTETVKNFFQCQSLCDRRSLCKSVKYNSRTRACTSNYRDIKSSNTPLTPVESWVIFQDKSAKPVSSVCRSKSCAENQVCVQLGSKGNCLTEAPTPCQKDFVKFKESCYWFSSDSTFRSWAQAKVYCENINAYLTTITSEEEDRFIMEHLLKNETGGGYLVGANDEQQEGSFFWMTNGEPERVSYTNWAPGQPDNAGDEEDCIEIWGNGSPWPFSWNDCRCDLLYRFICEQN